MKTIKPGIWFDVFYLAMMKNIKPGLMKNIKPHFYMNDIIKRCSSHVKKRE
jgi:hypothetical protein